MPPSLAPPLLMDRGDLQLFAAFHFEPGGPQPGGRGEGKKERVEGEGLACLEKDLTAFLPLFSWPSGVADSITPSFAPRREEERNLVNFIFPTAHFFWEFTYSVFLSFPGGEARSKAEVGIKTAGKVEEGHCPGMQGGFCPLHHWQEAGHVRPIQP